MAQFSSTGKPLCGSCWSLATHEVHAFDRIRGQVFFVYQCVAHRVAESRLLTAAHIDGLFLDHSFYHHHLFMAWLTAHVEMTVGCSADEENCPLAHFYSLYYGQRCLVTFGGDVRAAEDRDLFFCSLSPWAKVFMLALDFTHPNIEITGQQALDLLKGVR